MKPIYIFIISILLSSLNSCKSKNIANVKPEPMELYLCIGQSNMAGRAPIELQDTDSIENVFLFTGKQEKIWEKAANPLNKYSTVRKRLSMQKLGPSYTFAKGMIEAHPNKKIGLVVNAKGGTSIEEWSTQDSLYIKAVKQVKQAMKYGELKGVIWHQGEANASRYKNYLSKIEVLISSLRKDLNSPDLPFVVGQLSSDKPKRTNFNKMILELPNKISQTGVVTTENTFTIDSTHFNSASQRLLGRRYAKEMLKLID